MNPSTPFSILLGMSRTSIERATLTSTWVLSTSGSVPVASITWSIVSSKRSIPLRERFFMEGRPLMTLNASPPLNPLDGSEVQFATSGSTTCTISSALTRVAMKLA